MVDSEGFEPSSVSLRGSYNSRYTTNPCLVPLAGFEPAHTRRGILSPLCLPFHHSGIVWSPGRDSNSQLTASKTAAYTNFATWGILFIEQLRKRLLVARLAIQGLP